MRIYSPCHQDKAHTDWALTYTTTRHENAPDGHAGADFVDVSLGIIVRMAADTILAFHPSIAMAPHTVTVFIIQVLFSHSPKASMMPSVNQPNVLILLHRQSSPVQLLIMMKTFRQMIQWMIHSMCTQR